MSERFAPVAVIGYGCVFPPDSYDTRSFWDNLLSGRPGIAEPEFSRWDWTLYHSDDRDAPDRTYCRVGGFVRNYAFPHERHGVDPAVTAGMNRTQLLILDSACQALAMSTYEADRLGGSGLFVGNMLGDESLSDYAMRSRTAEVAEYLRGSPVFAALPEHTRDAAIAELPGVLSTRLPALTERADALLPAGLASVIADVLGVRGPAVLADGACASGLMIVDVATRYLQDRSLDVVLATGVMANMSATGNVSFAKIGGLSPSNTSRPLDADADGLIPGEGAGTVLLKRLDDAIRDGDTVHGVIRGVATRCDGKGKAIYAPSSRGQVSAMQRALETAGLPAVAIDHLESHATATPTGDGVELESVRQVYGARTGEPLSVGSLKALIGHTFPAAGMANLIKTLLAFDQGMIPPVHDVQTPQPILSDPASGLVLHQAATPWHPQSGSPRRAAANAFGFGGVNTSICLEQRSDDTQLGSVAARPGALAVIGVGAVLPGAHSYADLDPDVQFPLSGFPTHRWGNAARQVFDADGSWRAAIITDWEFPWRALRVPPATLADVDRAQQIAVVAAHEALHDAFADMSGWRDAGVFVGASAGLEAALTRNLRIRGVEYGQALRTLPALAGTDDATRTALVDAVHAGFAGYIPATTENALPGYMDNIIGGRIGNMLDLRGTNMVVEAGGDSFATALDIAARHLAQGDCPVALVGGVHANLTPEYVQPFRALLGGGALCPGEGAAFLVVCPVDAVPDGARVHALLDPPAAVPAGRTLPTSGPFFFGAQGAVEVVTEIRRMAELSDATATVETQAGTPGQGGHRIGIRRRVTAPSTAPATAHHSPPPLEDEGGALFVNADTVAELLARLDEARSGRPVDSGGRYTIAITYRDSAELTRKLALTETTLRSS